MPCSRSRITAAPVSTTVSSVIWLMIATTLLNHDETAFGLNSLRTTRLTGGAGDLLGAVQERRDAIVDDVPDVAGADAGLLHRGRVDVHLDGRVAAGAQVVLEARRDHDDEHQPPLVHLAPATSSAPMHDGELEARRIEGVEELLRQRRAVLVHERDRRVVDLARGPGRLDVDRQRERVDDEHDHHHVAHEAAKLLEPEPQDVQRATVTATSPAFSGRGADRPRRIGMQQAGRRCPAA